MLIYEKQGKQGEVAKIVESFIKGKTTIDELVRAIKLNPNQDIARIAKHPNYKLTVFGVLFLHKKIDSLIELHKKGLDVNSQAAFAYNNSKKRSSSTYTLLGLVALEHNLLGAEMDSQILGKATELGIDNLIARTSTSGESMFANELAIQGRFAVLVPYVNTLKELGNISIAVNNSGDRITMLGGVLLMNGDLEGFKKYLKNVSQPDYATGLFGCGLDGNRVIETAQGFLIDSILYKMGLEVLKGTKPMGRLKQLVKLYGKLNTQGQSATNESIFQRIEGEGGEKITHVHKIIFEDFLGGLINAETCIRKVNLLKDIYDKLGISHLFNILKVEPNGKITTIRDNLGGIYYHKKINRLLKLFNDDNFYNFQRGLLGATTSMQCLFDENLIDTIERVIKENDKIAIDAFSALENFEKDAIYEVFYRLSCVDQNRYREIFNFINSIRNVSSPDEGEDQSLLLQDNYYAFLRKLHVVRIDQGEINEFNYIRNCYESLTQFDGFQDFLKNENLAPSPEAIEHFKVWLEEKIPTNNLSYLNPFIEFCRKVDEFEINDERLKVFVEQKLKPYLAVAEKKSSDVESALSKEEKEQKEKQERRRKSEEDKLKAEEASRNLAENKDKAAQEAKEQKRIDEKQSKREQEEKKLKFKQEYEGISKFVEDIKKLIYFNEFEGVVVKNCSFEEKIFDILEVRTIDDYDANFKTALKESIKNQKFKKNFISMLIEMSNSWDTYSILKQTNKEEEEIDLEEKRKLDERQNYNIFDVAFAYDCIEELGNDSDFRAKFHSFLSAEYPGEIINNDTVKKWVRDKRKSVLLQIEDRRKELDILDNKISEYDREKFKVDFQIKDKIESNSSNGSFSSTSELRRLRRAIVKKIIGTKNARRRRGRKLYSEECLQRFLNSYDAEIKTVEEGCRQQQTQSYYQAPSHDLNTNAIAEEEKKRAFFEKITSIPNTKEDAVVFFNKNLNEILKITPDQDNAIILMIVLKKSAVAGPEVVTDLLRGWHNMETLNDVLEVIAKNLTEEEKEQITNILSNFKKIEGVNFLEKFNELVKKHHQPETEEDFYRFKNAQGDTEKVKINQRNAKNKTGDRGYKPGGAREDQLVKFGREHRGPRRGPQ